MQYDAEMYTDEALEKRSRLKYDASLEAAIRQVHSSLLCEYVSLMF